jgi:hypothetical protein
MKAQQRTRKASTMQPFKLTTAGLAFGVASLLTGSARATDCTTLANPVYMAGSTAIKATLSQIGGFLSSQNPPVTIVYAGSGSCNGVIGAINAASPNPTPLVSPSPNYFTYWTIVSGKVTANSCDIYPASVDGGSPNAYLNVGLSDVFASSCQVTPGVPPPVLPSNLPDEQGPVQAMTFVVPNGSSASSISAQAAYLVFGFGGKNGIKPVMSWTTDTTMYQRGSSSGTQSMIAVAIGLMPTRWYGNMVSSTGNMVTAISNADVPLTSAQSSTIGIMAAEDVDVQRINAIKGVTVAGPDGGLVPVDPPRELAYQHMNQNCGYLPDSAPNLFDKRNVRDGHYAIWGPVHAFPVPATPGSVLAKNIGTIVGLLTGTATMNGIDLVTFEAQNGIIPQCAMAVKRTTEIGAMSTQSAPCGCYYEHIANAVAGADTTCKPCQTPTDCPANYTCQTSYAVAYCAPS